MKFDYLNLFLKVKNTVLLIKELIVTLTELKNYVLYYIQLSQ
jgi:hypothetical protein